MNRLNGHHGFTLVEVAIVIIIIGIIAAVATQKMSQNIDVARAEQTKQEMEQLVFAIAGNPGVYVNGTRTDFGYIGDVGAPPTALADLVVSPDGYDTWDGPYIGAGYNQNDFRMDAWGSEYTYTGSEIISSGGPSEITKTIASELAHLTSNTVQGYVVDANHDVPGTNDTTSIMISLQYPNGAGGVALSSTYPRPNGNFSFTGIPIGAHTLWVVYIPLNDTATYNVTVQPNSVAKLSITFPCDLW